MATKTGFIQAMPYPAKMVMLVLQRITNWRIHGQAG